MTTSDIKVCLARNERITSLQNKIRRHFSHLYEVQLRIDSSRLPLCITQEINFTKVYLLSNYFLRSDKIKVIFNLDE